MPNIELRSGYCDEMGRRGLARQQEDELLDVFRRIIDQNQRAMVVRLAELCAVRDAAQPSLALVRSG